MPRFEPRNPDFRAVVARYIEHFKEHGSVGHFRWANEKLAAGRGRKNSKLISGPLALPYQPATNGPIDLLRRLTRRT